MLNHDSSPEYIQRFAFAYEVYTVISVIFMLPFALFCIGLGGYLLVFSNETVEGLLVWLFGILAIYASIFLLSHFNRVVRTYAKMSDTGTDFAKQ